KRASQQPCETEPPAICSHAGCQIQSRIRGEYSDSYRDCDQSIVIGCRNRGDAIHRSTLCQDKLLSEIIGRRRPALHPSANHVALSSEDLPLTNAGTWSADEMEVTSFSSAGIRGVSGDARHRPFG